MATYNIKNAGIDPKRLKAALLAAQGVLDKVWKPTKGFVTGSLGQSAEVLGKATGVNKSREWWGPKGIIRKPFVDLINGSARSSGNLASTIGAATTNTALGAAPILASIKESAYIEGFVDACMRRGVDPEDMYKRAQVAPIPMAEDDRNWKELQDTRFFTRPFHALARKWKIGRALAGKNPQRQWKVMDESARDTRQKLLDYNNAEAARAAEQELEYKGSLRQSKAIAGSLDDSPKPLRSPGSEIYVNPFRGRGASSIGWGYPSVRPRPTTPEIQSMTPPTAAPVPATPPAPVTPPVPATPPVPGAALAAPAQQRQNLIPLPTKRPPVPTAVPK